MQPDHGRIAAHAFAEVGLLNRIACDMPLVEATLDCKAVEIVADPDPCPSETLWLPKKLQHMPATVQEVVRMRVLTEGTQSV
jgi:hypothetical protein